LAAMAPGSMEVLGYLGLMLFLACAGFGALVGGQKDAALAGFLLGLVLGPLGVLIACFLDFRPQCPVCGGRIDRGYQKCWHCGADLDWRVSHVPQVPEPVQAPTAHPPVEPPPEVRLPNAATLEVRPPDVPKPVETDLRRGRETSREHEDVPGKTPGRRVRGVAVALGRNIVSVPRRTDLMLRALAGEENPILYGFLRYLLIGLISFAAAVVFVLLYVYVAVE